MPPPIQVLVLGSYPCIRPLHGGQIRLAEILAAYRRAGFNVQSMNLYDLACATGQPRGPHDFEYPADPHWRQWQGKSVPLVDDLTSGIFAASEEKIYQDMSRSISGSPRIVHLEQPWLLPLVLRWKREGRIPDARIVYGSQNIEAPLKRAILAQYGIAEGEEVARDIATLEQQACDASDLILAVSENDRQHLAAMTAKPVILAANGISPWQATPQAMETWRKKLPTTPFALFVGSAHPPNISGFFETLGDSLGFLPPDRKICLVGSVSPHILSHPRFQRWAPLNHSRVQSLGLLDDDSLAAVKTLAHTIILPITEGGGSNIKTAEALYSGKHVIGTPVSLRGYDDYLAMPGLTRATTPEDFRKNLRERLQSPALKPDPAWQATRERLLWQHTLTPMIDAIHNLLAKGRPEETHP